MNHNEISLRMLAFGGGLAMGVAFYLGLWWTVTRGLATQRSVFWFPGSMLLRMIGAVGGFFVISAGHWERLAACLLGFLVAQILVARYKPGPAARLHPHRRTSHAS